MRDEYVKEHSNGYGNNNDTQDTMINSDALMENCSMDSREQMIQEQLEQMSPFNESTIECPDMTEDPVFIQKLSKDIMAFWNEYKKRPNPAEVEQATKNLTDMMWKKLGERLHLSDKELEEERSHGLSNWMNEELGKIAKLDAIYKNHIQTIAILTEKIPETKNMHKSTIETMVRKSWIALTYLRSYAYCYDEHNNTYMRYLEFRETEGINNRQGDMTSFIETGLRISALRNFVDRIKSLSPTDKELAVMAALVLFSLAYHDQTTPQEDCLLIERYQKTLGPMLEQLLKKDETAVDINLSRYLNVLTDLSNLSSQPVLHYDKFVLPN